MSVAPSVVLITFSVSIWQCVSEYERLSVWEIKAYMCTERILLPSDLKANRSGTTANPVEY